MGVVCFGVQAGDVAGSVGSWQLQDGDFKYACRACSQAGAGPHALSGYLYSGVSSDTRRMIDDDHEAARHAPQIRATLVSELNRLLDDRGHSTTGSGFACGYLTKLCVMIAAHPTGDDLQEMNRLLIEATYLDSMHQAGRQGGWIGRLMAGQSRERQRRRQSAAAPPGRYDGCRRARGSRFSIPRTPFRV